MLKEMDWMVNTYSLHFVSMELLCLYRQHYLKQLSTTLDFPIHWKSPDLTAILKENANKKYITEPAAGQYDAQAREASGLDG
jgi:hypothetical protein